MKDRLRPGHRDDTGRNVVSESERSRSGTTVSVPGLPSSSQRHKAPWPSRQANSHNKFFSTVVPSPPNSIAGCLSLRTKCQLRLYLLRRVMCSPCARYETSVLSQWRRRRLLVLTAGFLTNFGRGRARDENLDRHIRAGIICPTTKHPAGDMRYRRGQDGCWNRATSYRTRPICFG